MFCKKNTIEDDITLPIELGSNSNPKLSRSPIFSSFENGVVGTYHILLYTTDDEQKILLLESSSYTIGRHEANSIILDSMTASRHHAYLIRIFDPNKKRYFFRVFDGDFNGKRSRNGLWINGKRRSAYTLKDHDVISFGEDFLIKYHIVSDRHDSRIASVLSVKELPTPQFKADLPQSTQIFPKTTEGGSLLQLDEHRVADSGNHNEMELARLSSFAEFSPHAIIETDLQGQITYYNPIAAIQFQELALGGMSAVTDGLFNQLQNGKIQTLSREVIVAGCVYEQSIFCFLQSQVIRSYFTEITHRKNLEQALKDTKNRFVAAVDGANDGIWDWDLLNNTIYFSTRWKMMLGYDLDEIEDDPEDWFSRIHPHDTDRVRRELDLHCLGSIPHFECEYRILHKNGTYRWVRARGLAVRNEQGEGIRIAGSQSDIHEQHLARAQLAHDALHDGMTGLPNRVLFLDRLKQALKHLTRIPNKHCAVLFLDLDRFKLINDSLGHMAGDELLIEVANRLKGTLRDEDTVARFGGDEFVILLNVIDKVGDAIQAANKVLSILRTTFTIQNHKIFTSASIGIAISDSVLQSPEELLQNADTAMYQAKHLGKNQYAVYGISMRGNSIQQLTLESDLQNALENDEFKLVYQPIVDIRSELLVGFEALIRWQHPRRGLVPPGEFIPVAEETVLIIPIGWWVLETAYQQLQAWKQQYPQHSHLSMSVNISSRQFLQEDLIKKIQTIASQNHIQPGELKLEITEGVAMHNPEMIARKFDQIQAQGIHLMMDDFGTGYSSLSYLTRFPVD